MKNLRRQTVLAQTIVLQHRQRSVLGCADDPYCNAWVVVYSGVCGLPMFMLRELAIAIRVGVADYYE